MARNTLEAWIPEEWETSRVVQSITQISAVESLAARIPMGSDTKHVPRTAGMDVAVVAKGGTYGEDTSLNDEVLLSAIKFGKAARIAEEDIDDSVANIIEAKMIGWGKSYAKLIDNASLAVSAASNGTTVPFTSLYQLLNTTDATLSYTGGANITTAASSGAPSYAEFSTAIGNVESGDYFDPGSMVAIAHPAFRKSLRGVLDSQNRPIFIEGLSGTPDTVFGVNVRWSLGAKLTATATSTPTGRALMAFVNPELMLLGVRSGPESVFIDGRDGLSALTDESILKMRARRGWAYGHPNGASILVG
jgi:HK97 family phage major capsid protein